VRHAERAHEVRDDDGQLLDDVCVLFGGREAEQLFFDDVSVGLRQRSVRRHRHRARAGRGLRHGAVRRVGMRRVELSSEDPVSTH
jgi:hypothetical protein